MGKKTYLGVENLVEGAKEKKARAKHAPIFFVSIPLQLPLFIAASYFLLQSLIKEIRFFLHFR